MKYAFVFLFCLSVTVNLTAQTAGMVVLKNNQVTDTTHLRKVYGMRPKYQLPLAAATVVLSSLGFKALDERARMTDADVMQLNPNDVNAFDRPTAVRDPSGFANAAGKGDFLLNFSVASPLLLALDKDMRRDWADLLTLYLATQAVDNIFYFTAIFVAPRPRPLAYNTQLSLAERTGIGMRKSFFSGHVSFSATATFFAVKVFTDYHQIKGVKRVLMYGAAAVPPLLVGYFRVESGRHFKTDVLVGLLSGATCGILVPELFRTKNNDQKTLSLTPYYLQGGGGVSMSLALNKKKTMPRLVSVD